MGEEFAKELFAHFFIVTLRKMKSLCSNRYTLSFALSTLAPPWKSGLPISRLGSIRFSKRAYPIYEEGLSDFRGGSSRFCGSLYPLCKTRSPAMQKTFVRSVKSLCPIELLQACSNSRPGLQYPSCSPIREYIMICPSPLAVARCGDGYC